MKKIYISGKVTGEDYEKVERFFNSAEFFLMLQSQTIFCINPLNYTAPSMSWQKAMRTCIKLLCSCDEIALLPNYKHSFGATIEYFIAKILHLKITKIPLEFKYKRNIKGKLFYHTIKVILWLFNGR